MKKKAVVSSKDFRAECTTAESEWQKFKGLMLRKKIEPLLFIFDKEKRHLFHTLFMLKPIDFVFINSQWKIVGKRTAKPWRPLVISKKPCRYVLELPAGEGKHFKINEKVKIK